MNKAAKLIEALATKFKEIKEYLPAGATDEEIRLIEETAEVILPQTLKDLLKIVNGGGAEGAEEPFGILGYFFYRCATMVHEINTFKQNDGKHKMYGLYQDRMIKNNMYSPKRIPFAYDCSGQYLCIDFDPDVNGEYGQIIYLPCGISDAALVIASNFDEYIDFLINAVHTDLLGFEDEREEWDEEEWEEWRTEKKSSMELLHVHFYRNWKADWTDLADAYNAKRNL